MKAAAATFFIATLAISHLNADPVTATFTGANGQTDSSGYLISPYSATLNGVDTTIYCLDFANEVSTGETWTANVTNLASGNLSNTRYGDITQTLATSTGTASYDGQQLYDMAAYLTTQLTPGSAANGDIQDTIWDLFNPNSGNGANVPPTPSTNSYLFGAEASLGNFNVSDFNVLTNVAPVSLTGSGQVQEFLFATPEPSSVMLLGFGLIAISIFGGRAIRRKENSL